MDPRFQTSFIPKKPLVATPSSAPKSVNLFVLLSTVVFIVALALSGGVFFYKQLTEKQIVANKANLEKAKGAFDPEIINQIVRLDTRIETAKKLMAGHLAVTPLFDFLSNTTLKTVRFTDFSYNYLSKDKIELGLKGQALNYAAVALQSDLINAQKQLRNTIISDMALENTGTVSFGVTANVDPALFVYSTSIGVTKPAANKTQ